ncbi:cuticle protein CP14.6-like [Arctopsyche grandis]|uniref:cuticle protein CP14.6-like n=1 Tax=Arctopsyche grandis TaxID=121162 RepID=UPI00406D957F
MPGVTQVGESVDTNIDPKTAFTHVYENEPWNGERYIFKFETSLGTVRMEEGFLEDSKNGGKSLVQLGFYTIIGKDNQVYLVEYYADESGYNQKSAAPLENRQVVKALAGNIVMMEGPICNFINCNKIHENVKKWRERRNSM